MAKKRKLSKEEKMEIKHRATLGRLCKPGCALIVFGKDMTAEERLGVYESGIRVMFSNDASEVTEFLETAAALEQVVTLIVRTEFAEDPTYFSTDIEPFLAYVGKNVDVKIFGHTPHDGVLDRLGIRKDMRDDRSFYGYISRWSPYCADTLGYGNRMKVLSNAEKKAKETRAPYVFSATELSRFEHNIHTPHDAVDIMENLVRCVGDISQET